MLETPLLAWRLTEPGQSIYASWEPDGEGWWHSTRLEVAFKPEPPYLRVRDRDGTLLDTPIGAYRRARQLAQALEMERAARVELEETVRRLRREAEPNENH